MRRYGDRSAIMPIDPVSDGTWIAVNDRGLCLVLLNAYDADPKAAEADWASGSDPQPKASRGTIIPRLMHHATAVSAFEEGEGLSPGEFPPFRLLLIDENSVGQVRSNGLALESILESVERSPIMYTSSGLGDAVVDLPRRELFVTCFRAGRNPADAQDEFHRHRWQDRPHLSVDMERPDARTVSRTVVEISRREIRMRYESIAPDGASEHYTQTLPRSFATA